MPEAVSSSSLSSPARPQLVLFAPAAAMAAPGGPPPASAEMLFSEFFRREFLPLAVPHASAEYLTSLAESVAWWLKLVGDRPLAAITDHDCAAFDALLAQQPGRFGERLSTRSRIKHCAQINRILAFAGPKTSDKRGRRRRALVAWPPQIDLVEPDDAEASGDLSADELLRILSAGIAAARKPRVACGPAAWWRSFAIVGVAAALRRAELLGIERRDLAGERLTVRREVSKTKTRIVWLGPAAIAALDAMAPAGCDPSTRFFPWPLVRGTSDETRTKQAWEEWTERILPAAGVAKQRGVCFHALRKTTATQLAVGRHSGGGGGEEGAALAQAQLGHSNAATTKRHYINAQKHREATGRQAAAAIERLVQEILDGPRDPQRLLFT